MMICRLKTEYSNIYGSITSFLRQSVISSIIFMVKVEFQFSAPRISGLEPSLESIKGNIYLENYILFKSEFIMHIYCIYIFLMWISI